MNAINRPDIANAQPAQEELVTFRSQDTGNQIPLRDLEEQDLQQMLAEHTAGRLEARQELSNWIFELAKRERIVGVLEFELERRNKALLLVPALNL